jgi:hypothetical protein
MSIYEVNLSRPIVDRNDGSYADFCNLRVTFDLPSGLTFATIKLSLPSARFWSLNKNMDLTDVKGKLSQLDDAGNVLKESVFDVTPTSPFTDTPETGIAKIRVEINELDYTVSGSTGLYYWDYLSEINFTLLNIEFLDSGGSVVLAVHIINKYLVFTFRTPQSVNISDVTPTYVLELRCPNTSGYIGGWGFRITNVSGLPDETDNITIQSLAEDNSVIETKTIGVAIGNYDVVSHSTNVAKLRVKLNSVKHLVVNGDVLEVGKWL